MEDRHGRYRRACRQRPGLQADHEEGCALVYNISYGTLAEPGMMLSEFHGHTKQVDGVGDLMFYSKTAARRRAASSPRRRTASTAGISRTTARKTSS
jgi:hypothetical protein